MYRVLSCVQVKTAVNAKDINDLKEKRAGSCFLCCWLAG